MAEPAPSLRAALAPLRAELHDEAPPISPSIDHRNRRRIAIVGAGFSGTMVATHLLHSEAPPGTDILLFERTGCFGAGVAYGTMQSSHLLNVPAARMSALDDTPDDFLDFVRTRDPTSSGGAFVPRMLYGEYLVDRLARAERRGAERGVTLHRIAGSVMTLCERAEKDFSLTTGDGQQIDAEFVVLALGNFPPPPLVPDAGPCPRYVADPWAAGALHGFPDGPVLLVGTGLTMLDVALAIGERRPCVRMLAVSRHGLVPRPHRATNASPPMRERPRDLDGWPRTARGTLRALRREVREAAQRGIDWREVVTSLRADTPAVWQSLPIQERARFLAHVRPYWEIHRHRAAPSTADGVAKLIASGRLILRAGHILGYRSDRSEGVEVQLRPRGATRVELLRVARIVNCTGPQTDLRRLREPLVRSLLAARLVRPDPLRLGLDATDVGAVLDATGTPNRRLYAVGPLCKGRSWEMTAVPELRGAAARLAHKLGCELAAAPTRRPGA